MRGEYAEFNPWQVPMGSITDACLRLCGFLVYRIEKAEDVADVVAAACDISFDSNQNFSLGETGSRHRQRRR